jgi:hypothetical protein
MKTQYCYINTEWFSDGKGTVPLGTILKYTEDKRIWRIGPYGRDNSHWSYPVKGAKDYDVYKYVKEYITLIDMDKPLMRLVFE